MSRQSADVDRVLTTGDSICMEKALLIYLEDKYTEMDDFTESNGWRLYADYYTRLTLIDDNVNISGFRRQKHLSQKVFKSLYEYETPEKPPQGFIISDSSNLFRLAILLNIEILILTSNHEIWFNSCKKPLSECGGGGGGETFIITNNKELHVLYTRPQQLTIPSNACQRWISICEKGGFQYAFELLMQFPQQTSIPTPPGLTSNEFITHSNTLSHDYRIHECIIVFQYVGNMSANRCQKKKVKHVNLSQTFIYLGKEPTSEADIIAATPLFIYGDYLCVPTFTYIMELRRQLANTRHHHVRRDNRQFTPVANISHLEAIRLNEEAFCERRKTMSLKRKRLYEKKARKRMRIMCGEPDEEEEEEEKKDNVKRPIEKICQCHICRKEAPSNMSQHGQEQLTTIKMGCYDLLISLGINTVENRDIINTLCQWSIASFDIESMTQSIDNSTPLLNSFCRYNTAKQHSYIGGVPQHFINIQKPIMIGHSDCFNTNVDIVQITDYIEDEDEDDDTNGDVYVYTMVERYWSDIVIPRHEAVIRAKEDVAKPLVEYLQKYNVAHVSFISSKVHEELQGDAIKTYHHTLPGLLQARITKLIRQYIIFSFYGSGYDMVMLEAYLIPFLFEESQQRQNHSRPPRIDKKGEKVILIKLTNGISFRDVTKLLAPSTNLRSFGALFNLPVAKGHFPFKILKGPHSLNIPTLPKDKRTWESTLSSNQKPITQSEVNDAIAFYNRSGFTNVGQYLKHYLTLDVMILQQATDLWRQRLSQVIGLDFIDIEKFTISSLSNYAGNHKSANLCRPGWFFPNNGQMYALLKRGMRG